MAIFAVQNIPSQKALNPVTFAATDGTSADTFPNDGNTILLLDNTDVGASTVTVNGVNDPKFGCLISETIVMAASTKAAIGPLAQTGWNQGGSVFFTSDNALVLAAVVRYAPRA